MAGIVKRRCFLSGLLSGCLRQVRRAVAWDFLRASSPGTDNTTDATTKESTSTHGYKDVVAVLLSDVGGQSLEVVDRQQCACLRVKCHGLQKGLGAFGQGLGETHTCSASGGIAQRAACHSVTHIASQSTEAGGEHRSRAERIQQRVGHRTSDDLSLDLGVSQVIAIALSCVIERGQVHREADASGTSSSTRSHGSSTSAGRFKTNAHGTAAQDDGTQSRSTLDRGIDDALPHRAVLSDQGITDLLVLSRTEHTLSELPHGGARLSSTSKLHACTDTTDRSLGYLPYTTAQQFTGGAALSERVQVLAIRRLRQGRPPLTGRCLRGRSRRRLQCGPHVLSCEGSVTGEHLVRGFPEVRRRNLGCLDAPDRFHRIVTGDVVFTAADQLVSLSVLQISQTHTSGRITLPGGRGNTKADVHGIHQRIGDR